MNSPGHLRIEELELAPGQEWNDASQAWRFVRVGSGAAYWLDRIAPRALNEGEMVVIEPASSAVFRASQLNSVLLHWFKFVPELLCGFFTLAERHIFETQSAAKPARFLPSTHPLSQQFSAVTSSKGPDQEIVRRAEVLGLAVAFFSEGLLRPRSETTRSLSAHSRFQQIICQMPDMEIVHHTPEELAALCGCSPRHFNRLFRNHFGVPPRAKQTELRLVKARQLLGSTDAKIIQVALESGYRSLSLFNSLFRRHFGMSPSEYREKAARNLQKVA